MSVALRGITKKFGSLFALDGVDLDVDDGKIHALLGANGSGKSTLVRILTGAYVPDSGIITTNGRDITHNWSPSLADSAGVRVVYQEAPLLDQLSISESVALFSGYPRGALGNINWRELNKSTQRMLDELGIQRLSRDSTSTLSGAERALVALEIAVRTASNEMSLLILDEATASLPNTEAQPFLQRVRKIADEGLAVLMVTHRLPELVYTDHITVIDSGQIAMSRPSSGVLRKEVLEVMRGRSDDELSQRNSEIENLKPQETWQEIVSIKRSSTQILLKVENLQGTEIESLSFELDRGEILGVIGPRGGGMDELPQLLTGAKQRSAGSISLLGQILPKKMNPSVALEFGICYLPADRLHEGGIASLNVGENAILPDIFHFWHKKSEEIKAIDQIIKSMKVVTQGRKALFGTLSGGNQQKVILGRLLRLKPNLLVLADPTYGVDPLARQTMFEAIRTAKMAGVAVILTSTEPEQLIDLCDRVLILSDGYVKDILQGSELTDEFFIAEGL